MALKGSAKHNPRFHAFVLLAGFVVGGFLTEFGRRFLPSGAVKEFFTTGATASLGAIQLDLIIVSIGVGPFAFDVSLLGLLGVLVAYLIARSMF